MKKLILASAVNVAFFTLLSRTALAVTIPPFTDCTSPNGTLKVSYDNGTHGIVGDSGIFTGSDKVYTISDKSLTQCFCPPDGNGIQTDWFKADDLTTNEVQSLQNQGWILILDGSAWGLDKSPYLAKNKTFSCNNGARVGGIEITKTNESAGVGGSVLGISTPSVLGIAATGNTKTVTALVIIGVIFVIVGFMLGRRKK